MDMDRALTIVMGQIEKHKKIHDAAMELGERKWPWTTARLRRRWRLYWRRSNEQVQQPENCDERDTV